MHIIKVRLVPFWSRLLILVTVLYFVMTRSEVTADSPFGQKPNDRRLDNEDNKKYGYNNPNQIHIERINDEINAHNIQKRSWIPNNDDNDHHHSDAVLLLSNDKAFGTEDELSPIWDEPYLAQSQTQIREPAHALFEEETALLVDAEEAWGQKRRETEEGEDEEEEVVTIRQELVQQQLLPPSQVPFLNNRFCFISNSALDEYHWSQMVL